MKYALTLIVLLVTGCSSNKQLLDSPDIDLQHLLYDEQHVAVDSPVETKLPDNWHEHNVG